MVGYRSDKKGMGWVRTGSGRVGIGFELGRVGLGLGLNWSVQVRVESCRVRVGSCQVRTVRIREGGVWDCARSGFRTQAG